MSGMQEMSDSGGGLIPTWNLADRLRKAREHAGFKRQEDIAAVLHVSRSAVGNWETGENKPSYLALLRWSEVTGVPLVWIQHGVGGDDDNGVTSAVTDRYLRILADEPRNLLVAA